MDQTQRSAGRVESYAMHWPSYPRVVLYLLEFFLFH
jgi:hypothetical protein